MSAAGWTKRLVVVDLCVVLGRKGMKVGAAAEGAIIFHDEVRVRRPDVGTDIHDVCAALAECIVSVLIKAQVGGYQVGGVKAAVDVAWAIDRNNRWPGKCQT